MPDYSLRDRIIYILWDFGLEGRADEAADAILDLFFAEDR